MPLLPVLLVMLDSSAGWDTDEHLYASRQPNAVWLRRHNITMLVHELDQWRHAGLVTGIQGAFGLTVYLWLALQRARSQKLCPTPLQCQLTTADDACCLSNALVDAWGLLRSPGWSLGTTSPVQSS